MPTPERRSRHPFAQRHENAATPHRDRGPRDRSFTPAAAIATVGSPPTSARRRALGLLAAGFALPLVAAAHARPSTAPATAAPASPPVSTPDGRNPAAASEQPDTTPLIPAFVARYRAQAFGNELLATARLRYDGPRAHFSLDAEVQGFIRLLGRFAFERRSTARVGADRFWLEESQARQETPRRTRTSEARIIRETPPDGPSRTRADVRITGRVDGRDFALVAPASVDDFLTSLLNAMRAAVTQTIAASTQVTLVERGQLRRYRLTVAGSETLSIAALGRVDTTRVDRFDADGARVFSAWLVPDRHGVPARFDYIDDGRSYQLELQSVTFSSPDGAGQAPA